MAREFSDAEREKKERLASEREAKKREKQAEKERIEREELKRLDAQLRNARKTRRKTEADVRKKNAANAFSAAEARVKSTFEKVGSRYEKAEEALSRFASKKFALPVLIVIAFLGCFLTALIGGYNAFGFDTDMQFTFYQLSLCDFSAGFVSRVIVGAVISLFCDTVTIKQMNVIACAAVLVSLLLFAVIIGAVLRKGLRERSFLPVLLAVVLMLDPIVVQSNYKFLGTLDVYTLIIFIITLCTYGTPVFYIAAPVLSVLGMTVHYHYLFSFFPAVAALFVYDMFLSEKKSRRIRSTAGLFVTAAAGCGSFYWFVFMAKDHLKCTADEFCDRMVSRFDVPLWTRRGLEQIFDGCPIFRIYFDYYIFGYHKGVYHYDSKTDFVDYLRIDRLNRTNVALYYKYFPLVLPLLIAFIVLWMVCASRQRGSRKLPYIAFACIQLALFPELFISTDILRWMSAVLTCQFALLFAIYLRGDKTVRELLPPRKDGGALRGKCVCILCAAVYITVMLIAGRDLPMFY